MEDYYELVGLERTASREEIDRKLREQLRLWQRRTTTADLDRRQQAERRVQQLAEARTTLLDEEKRRRYDRQLTAYKVSEPPPGRSTSTGTRTGSAAGGGTETGAAETGAGETGPGGTWLSQARGFLVTGDHQAAAYAAREALRASPNPPPETWTVLARANTELGRLDDALFEAHRATTAGAGSVEAHLALAEVHERRQEWSEAHRAYETASRLDPDDEAAYLGVARTLARSGRPGTALTQLERRYLQSRHRPMAGRLLARGLVEAAGAILREPQARLRSPAEQGTVTRMLHRAREVTTDLETLSVVNRLEQQLTRARTGTKSPRGDTSWRTFQQQTQSPVPPRTSVLATVSLILALVGVGTCLTAPVGAILGHMARTQIRERGELGEGVALAGIIIGWVVTGLYCCGGFALFSNT